MFDWDVEFPIRSQMTEFVLDMPVYPAIGGIQFSEPIVAKGFVTFPLTDGVSILFKKFVSELFRKENLWDAGHS